MSIHSTRDGCSYTGGQIPMCNHACIHRLKTKQDPPSRKKANRLTGISYPDAAPYVLRKFSSIEWAGCLTCAWANVWVHASRMQQDEDADQDDMAGVVCFTSDDGSHEADSDTLGDEELAKLLAYVGLCSNCKHVGTNDHPCSSFVYVTH